MILQSSILPFWLFIGIFDEVRFSLEKLIYLILGKISRHILFKEIQWLHIAEITQYDLFLLELSSMLERTLRS